MEVNYYLLCVFALCAAVVDGSRKMLLEDVQVLTLYAGKMTTARRGHPVPQLKCLGGTAGCDAFQPQVVQCYNRGYDGYDVQWECKTDMDNDYRFGKIEVTCEGYESPEDNYILKGSCGLEYTLDLTKQGYSQKKSHQGSHYSNTKNNYSYSSLKQSSKWGDLIILAIVGLIIYAMYKTCLSDTRNQYSTTNSDHPSDDSYQHNRGGGGIFGNLFGNGGYDNNAGYPSAPPPYGFRPEHYNAGCGGAQQRPMGGGNFGGFWSGAATGGILGYMFGNRNQGTGYNTGYRSPSSRTSSSSDSNAAFGGMSDSYGSSSSGSGGTRTASGFGGTRRR